LTLYLGSTLTKRPDAWEAEESEPTAMELATMSNIVKTGYDLSKLKDCAIQAGAGSNASKVAMGALRKMGNNPKMQHALKKAGITASKLAEKLSQLLDCEHPAYPGKPDNTNQLRAFETAVRIMDGMPNPRLEIDNRETISINITAELVDRIRKVTGEEIIDVTPRDDKGFFPEGS